MSIKTIKIKEFVKYKGHNVTQNGVVKLNFTAMYSELTKSIQTLQMLNNDIKLVCKMPETDPFTIGVFRIKNVIVDGDGESTLKFESTNDFVEMDNLSKIVVSDEFVILMKSNVELEEENG